MLRNYLYNSSLKDVIVDFMKANNYEKLAAELKYSTVTEHIVDDNLNYKITVESRFSGQYKFVTVLDKSTGIYIEYLCLGSNYTNNYHGITIKIFNSTELIMWYSSYIPCAGYMGDHNTWTIFGELEKLMDDPDELAFVMSTSQLCDKGYSDKLPDFIRDVNYMKELLL